MPTGWTCSRILEGHRGLVGPVAYSPDGRVLAVVSGGHTVRLWDPATGRCLSTLEGHSEQVREIAFSPTGRLLASGGVDKAVRLWNPDSGGCLRTLDGHGADVAALAFSTDGKLLASGDIDGSIRLWDPSNGRSLRTMGKDNDEVLTLAFSPDGKLLACNDGQTIRLWDVLSGECVRTLEGHSDQVCDVAFSPSGKVLASCSQDKTIRLWEPGSWVCSRVLEGHDEGVVDVAFSRKGDILSSAGTDWTVRLWDVSSGDCIRVLGEHRGPVIAVAFSPTSTKLASSSWDGTIKVWDTASPTSLRTVFGYAGPVNSVAFARDGEAIVSGGLTEREGIVMWDAASGSCLNTFGGSLGEKAIALDRAGHLLASVDLLGKTIKLWDLDSSSCLRTLVGDTQDVLSIAVSPDGTILASGSFDNAVRLWDTKTGLCKRTLEDGGPVQAVTFRADGTLLASAGGGDGIVRLWDPASGVCLRTLKGHGTAPDPSSPTGKKLGYVTALDFSPDGRLLASASHDESIRVWDAESGECLRTLEGHSAPVLDVAFSPDGELLASAGEDSTIRLWDPRAGDRLGVLEGHSGKVQAVAFSPDSRLLASAGWDATVRVWELDPNGEPSSLGADTYGEAKALLSQGRQAVAEERYEDAILTLGNCLRLWPSDQEAWRLLGQAHYGLATADLRAFDTLVKEQDIDAALRFRHLSAEEIRAIEEKNQANSEHYASAADAFARLLELRPDDVKALWDLALCLMRLKGREQEAIDAWTDYLALRPDDTFAREFRDDLMARASHGEGVTKDRKEPSRLPDDTVGGASHPIGTATGEPKPPAPSGSLSSVTATSPRSPADELERREAVVSQDWECDPADASFLIWVEWRKALDEHRDQWRNEGWEYDGEEPRWGSPNAEMTAELLRAHRVKVREIGVLRKRWLVEEFRFPLRRMTK